MNQPRRVAHHIGTWIVTGLSGAGKQTALRSLERRGIVCVDNLPVTLLERFAAEPRESGATVVVDARQATHLDGFRPPAGVRVLFLDARDEVLVRRLAESTRPHPLAVVAAGREAVVAERSVLQPMRAAADVVVDTSDMTPDQLADRVADVIGIDDRQPGVITCTVSSFGFKHGPQIEADWVVDARILRNPFWEPDLRPLTGLDEPVRRYVLDQPVTLELVDRLATLVHWTLDRAVEHGRAALHVAVGCTGGRHRSVVVAEALAGRLREGGHAVVVRHRDVSRPDPR